MSDAKNRARIDAVTGRSARLAQVRAQQPNWQSIGAPSWQDPVGQAPIDPLAAFGSSGDGSLNSPLLASIAANDPNFAPSPGTNAVIRGQDAQTAGDAADARDLSLMPFGLGPLVSLGRHTFTDPDRAAALGAVAGDVLNGVGSTIEAIPQTFVDLTGYGAHPHDSTAAPAHADPLRQIGSLAQALASIRLDAGEAARNRAAGGSPDELAHIAHDSQALRQGYDTSDLTLPIRMGGARALLNTNDTGSGFALNGIVPEIVRSASVGPFIDEQRTQRALEAERELGADAATRRELANRANADSAFALANGAGVIGDARVGAEALDTLHDVGWLGRRAPLDGITAPDAAPHAAPEPVAPMRAAVRDPQTGHIFEGSNHWDAIDNAPADAQSRLEAAYGDNPDGADIGFTRGGQFLTRQQAMDALGHLAGPVAGAGLLTAAALDPDQANGRQMAMAGALFGLSPLALRGVREYGEAFRTDLGRLVSAGRLTSDEAEQLAANFDASSGRMLGHAIPHERREVATFVDSSPGGVLPSPRANAPHIPLFDNLGDRAGLYVGSPTSVSVPNGPTAAMLGRGRGLIHTHTDLLHGADGERVLNPLSPDDIWGTMNSAHAETGLGHSADNISFISALEPPSGEAASGPLSNIYTDGHLPPMDAQSWQELQDEAYDAALHASRGQGYPNLHGLSGDKRYLGEYMASIAGIPEGLTRAGVTLQHSLHYGDDLAPTLGMLAPHMDAARDAVESVARRYYGPEALRGRGLDASPDMGRADIPARPGFDPLRGVGGDGPNEDRYLFGRADNGAPVGGGSILSGLNDRSPQSVAEEILNLRRDASNEPMTLSQWVRRRGGIADDRGDVGDIQDQARGFARLTNPRGRSIDDMAQGAWEEGFFPDHAEAPTANEFIDALNGDYTGRNPIVADLGGAENVRHARDTLDAFNEAGIDTNLRGRRLANQVRSAQAGPLNVGVDHPQTAGDRLLGILPGAVVGGAAGAALDGQDANADSGGASDHTPGAGILAGIALGAVAGGRGLRRLAEDGVDRLEQGRGWMRANEAGETYDQIATREGVTRNTVAGAINRAKNPPRISNVNAEPEHFSPTWGTDEEFQRLLPTDPEQWRQAQALHPWMSTPSRAQAVIMWNALNEDGRPLFSADDVLSKTGLTNVDSLRSQMSQARAAGIPLIRRQGSVIATGGDLLDRVLSADERAQRNGETLTLEQLSGLTGVPARNISNALSQVRTGAANRMGAPEAMRARVRAFDDARNATTTPPEPGSGVDPAWRGSAQRARLRRGSDPLAGIAIGAGAAGGVLAGVDDAHAEDAGLYQIHPLPAGVDLRDAMRVDGQWHATTLPDGSAGVTRTLQASNGHVYTLIGRQDLDTSIRVLGVRDPDSLGSPDVQFAHHEPNEHVPAGEPLPTYGRGPLDVAHEHFDPRLLPSILTGAALGIAGRRIGEARGRPLLYQGLGGAIGGELGGLAMGAATPQDDAAGLAEYGPLLGVGGAYGAEGLRQGAGGARQFLEDNMPRANLRGQINPLDLRPPQIATRFGDAPLDEDTLGRQIDARLRQGESPTLQRMRDRGPIVPAENRMQIPDGQRGSFANQLRVLGKERLQTIARRAGVADNGTVTQLATRISEASRNDPNVLEIARRLAPYIGASVILNGVGGDDPSSSQAR